MYVNLHTLPVDQSLFTVAFTSCPVDTPHDDRWYDEVDVQAPATATVAEVIALAIATGDVEGRVAGVVNQTDAYVVAKDWAGIEV